MSKETQEEAKNKKIDVPPDLANMVRVIASHREITIPEVMNRCARTGITREYRKVVGEMNTVLGGESGA